MTFVSRRLDPDSDLPTDQFSCGNQQLGDWLHKHARTSAARDLSRTWVWLDTDGTIAGYYALTGHVIKSATLPSREGRSVPDEVPTVLLSKLARSEAKHGQGLGELLLVEALQRCVQASESVGYRFVVVDAIDDRASNFYQRYGLIWPRFSMPEQEVCDC